MNDLTVYSDFFKEVINTINPAKYETYKPLNKHHIGQDFEIGKLIDKNQEKNTLQITLVFTDMLSAFICLICGKQNINR